MDAPKLVIGLCLLLCAAVDKNAQVWLPVVAANSFAAVYALLCMCQLHASSVSNEKKMAVAATVADSTSQLLCANPKTGDQKPKMQPNST